MITKILFTALVVAVVFGAARFRAKQVANAPAPAARKEAAGPSIRTMAYIIAAMVVASSAVIYVQAWMEDRQVITIRVVNTQTGETVSYDAHKGSISGRSFETVDGWKVTVSELERVEVVEAP